MPACVLLALCAGASWAIAGCRPERQPFCQLGAEHELARTSAKDVDGIALVALGERVLALWSEQGGLFARFLARDGQPLLAARRLSVRCEGGLAAQREGDAVTVACLLRPERGKHERPGAVLLLRVGRALELLDSRELGTAGDLSSGIALARGARGLELAWHDGSPDAQRVWWTELYSGAAAPRVVSEAGRLASAPSLATVAGTTVMSWAENWIESGPLRSRIVYWDRKSSPRTLVPVVHVAAVPQLFALGREPVLGFRDHRGHEKTGLYLSRLTAAGQPGRAMRVGRADGIGRPAIEPCMGGVVAGTPRTYGGDYFVGVNWLDHTLTRARGEQQFYEDAHAFTQVVAACMGTHALLMIAEFPQLQRESLALRAVPYRCR